MKVETGNCKIIIEAGKMEIEKIEADYNEDVYFDYIKLIGTANKISTKQEMKQLAEKFNEYYDGIGILYQLPKFFETASEIKIKFEDATNEISPYFVEILKTVKEIYPEAEKVEIDNDFVKIIYDNGNIKIIVSDSEFNEEIWINASELKAKCRFDGISSETLEEFEKYAIETIENWIQKLKENKYINYFKIKKIELIDDNKNVVKILKE